jgi:hypothetical protein
MFHPQAGSFYPSVMQMQLGFARGLVDSAVP